jgi:hypothetical protein
VGVLWLLQLGSAPAVAAVRGARVGDAVCPLFDFLNFASGSYTNELNNRLSCGHTAAAVTPGGGRGGGGPQHCGARALVDRGVRQGS